MKYYGRKIYYDIVTGEILAHIPERNGEVIQTTKEQDISTFKALSERNEESFALLELEYGDYADDFATKILTKIDINTGLPLFQTVEDFNGGREDAPVYIPVSEEVKALKEQVAAQSQTIATQEQAIAELTMIVAMK